MILTVTLNPSLDRRYFIQGFEKGKVYRAEDVQYTPGGKGLNVAKVIRSFNEPVMATGFLGGRNGRHVEEMLDDMGIYHNFIPIKGETRSSLTILSDDGSPTEVLEESPSISGEEVLELYKVYRELIRDSKIICASGSIPQGLPTDIYRDLIIMANEQDKKFFLDTKGEALKIGIEASPFLVKLNRDELEGLIGCMLTSQEDIIRGARYILENGVKIVIIPLRKAGYMVFYDGYFYKVKVPNIKMINSVGSEDSMMAGFVVSLLRNYDFEYLLKVAAACGIANAMEAEAGKVDMHNMKKIMNDVDIEKIKIRSKF